MTGPIDTAYVEIEPSFPNFANEVRRGVDRGLDDAESSARDFVSDLERLFENLTRDLADEFVRLGDRVDTQFEQMSDSASDNASEISRAIDDAADDASADAARMQRNFDRAFNAIAADARRAGASVGSSLSAGTKVAAAAIVAGTAAIGYGLYQIGSFGLQSAAQLEQLQISFNSLLGSAERGQEVFSGLQQFAAETPFEFPDVARAGQRFLAFNDAVGMSDDQLQTFLTTIGNVISVTGGGAQALDSVTLAMGQIASSGKLTLDNLNQISEAMPGFSGVAAIASSTGLTTAEVMDKISKGEISATVGMDALIKGMERFPGAAGAMEAQSQTLLGVFSTFKDVMSQSLASAFEPVIPAIKTSLEQITPIFQSALDILGPAIGESLAAILPLIGDLVSGIVPIIAPLLTAFSEGLANIGPAIAPLGNALAMVAEALAPILPMLGTLIGALAGALAPVIQSLVPVITSFVTAIQPIIGPLADNFAVLGQLLATVLVRAFILFGSALEALGPVIGQIMPMFSEAMIPIWIELAMAVSQLILALVPLIPALVPLIPPLAELAIALIPIVSLMAQLLVVAAQILAPILQLAAALIELGVVNIIVPAIELLTGALETILGPLEPLIEKMSQFGEWLEEIDWGGIGDTISSAFTDAFSAVGDFFSELPGKILGFIQNLPSMLANLARQAFEAFFFAIGFGIGLVIGAFQVLPGKAWDLMKSMWDKIKELFQNGAQAVGEFMSSLPDRIGSIMTSLASTIQSAARSAIDGLVRVMREGPQKAKDALSELPGKIKSAMSNAASWLYDAGGQLIRGMINGIKAKAGELVRAAKDAVTSGINAAKKALGISSPSRVFQTLGEQSADGYIGGWDTRVIEVKQAVDNAVSPTISNVTNNTSARYSEFSGGGTTVIVKIGERELSDVVVDTIHENPQDVAQASEQGTRELARR